MSYKISYPSNHGWIGIEIYNRKRKLNNITLRRINAKENEKLLEDQTSEITAYQN